MPATESPAAPRDAYSVQADGERLLATFLRALAVADACGLRTVVLTVAGHRVTVGPDDLADYVDGAIDRAELADRWGFPWS